MAAVDASKDFAPAFEFASGVVPLEQGSVAGLDFPFLDCLDCFPGLVASLSTAVAFFVDLPSRKKIIIINKDSNH